MRGQCLTDRRARHSRCRPRTRPGGIRVHFLAAELPNLLRGVAQLPPEERGAWRGPAQQERRRLDAAIEARRRGARGRRLEQQLSRRRVLDVTLPGSRGYRRPPPPDHRDPARGIEDVFMTARGGGPRDRARLLQDFDALDLHAAAPGAPGRAGITLADLQRHAAGVRPHEVSATSPRRAPLRPHFSFARAQHRVRRELLQAARAAACATLALPALKGTSVDRDPQRG